MRTQRAIRCPSTSTRRSSGVFESSMSPSIVARRPIALSGPGSRDLQERLAADEQGAAERLVSLSFVDGNRLSGEDGFVEHGSVRIAEDAVGRDAVARLESHPITGHEGLRREPNELTVAKHPRLRPRQRFEPRQRCFGALLLVEAESGVEQEDQADGGRLDRPAVRALVHPEPEIEREREQQDEDQRTVELTQEAPPERLGRLLRKRIRSKPCESFSGFRCREAVHRNTSVHPKTERDGSFLHPSEPTHSTKLWLSAFAGDARSWPERPTESARCVARSPEVRASAESGWLGLREAGRPALQPITGSQLPIGCTMSGPVISRQRSSTVRLQEKVKVPARGNESSVTSCPAAAFLAKRYASRPKL